MGEYGTCEASVNGKCEALFVSSMARGVGYVVRVKEVNNKAESLGKFIWFHSSFLDDNGLGMVCLVILRRAAKKNFEERVDYEDLIRGRGNWRCSVCSKVIARDRKEWQRMMRHFSVGFLLIATILYS
jgi:hypothetical protein